MKPLSPTPCSLLLLCFIAAFAFLLPAQALEEGVRDEWGTSCIVLKEPVVPRSVVHNSNELARLQSLEERLRQEGREDLLSKMRRPSPADCGLELFTVSGSPAPRFHWVDQNKLQILFAPGSSPKTEYCLSFKPGTTYLSGAPLAQPSFRFRCKPARFMAQMLPEHAGGAALVWAPNTQTLEARQLPTQHEGLSARFLRVRHIPLVGWVQVGSVPALLEPAPVQEALSLTTPRELVDLLLKNHQPEEIRPETPLPQCLLARPQRPLKPGASYMLELRAAADSGFEGGVMELGEAPGLLEPVLRARLAHGGNVHGDGARRDEEESEKAELPPGTTLLTLSVNHPVPESQLRALWEQLSVRVLNVPTATATRQADGSILLSGLAEGGEATLRLHRLLSCEPLRIFRRTTKGPEYRYSPPGCAMGLELLLTSARPLELELTLPPLLSTRHGLGMGKQPQQQRVSALPACPAMTGNGCNELAFSGSHQLRLPCINVQGARATAYHWEPEAAARLLPLIQRGMRDDTIACELLLHLQALHRRAAEGQETEGMQADKRQEATRALRLLARDREWQTPLRDKALAEATAHPTLALSLPGQPGGLVQEGELLLDLDQLTAGKLRPGLYLISLATEPNTEVRRALALYQRKPLAEVIAPPCTVDYLVLVSDISARIVGDRLLVNSMATGEPLEGVQAESWKLPPVSHRRAEEEEQGGQGIDAPATLMGQLDMPQGALRLPPGWEDNLVLLRRGEDYSLIVPEEDELHYRQERITRPTPAMQVEMLCDRPLYRPGELVHVRAVLRCPKAGGGLALPTPREVELHFLKPNNEVLETRRVPLDAYGAVTADFRLPSGEEDIAGIYSCKLITTEGGKEVVEHLGIDCQVFRRNSFTVELEDDLDPAAPSGCTLRILARDYNGSPVAGGKLRLQVSSIGVPLQDEAGAPAETFPMGDKTVHKFIRELRLDTEGRAEWKGRFGDYAQEGCFEVTASVANDREEYVEAARVVKSFSPVDFFVRLGDNRLRLLDVRTDEPLARAQELRLRVTKEFQQRRELPSGFYSFVSERREVFNRCVTVPANSERGCDLVEALGEHARLFQSYGENAVLEISGRDEAGHVICYECRPWLNRGQAREERDGASEFCRLEKAEGHRVKFMADEPLPTTGKLHVLVHSQGKLRHALAQPSADAKQLEVELTAQEYGEVSVTAVFCERDHWGIHRRWHTLCGNTSVTRPDKLLKVELNLPQGAKPGQLVSISGRVTDAAGKPVKAALTLFAVDAGMMSVSSYTLPDLTERFYAGWSSSVQLSQRRGNLVPCRPRLLDMPDVWGSHRFGWSQGSRRARTRSVYPLHLETRALLGGLGSLCRLTMENVVSQAQPRLRWWDVFALGDLENEMCAAPAPSVVLSADSGDSLGEGGAGLGSVTGGHLRTGAAPASNAAFRAKALAEVDALWDEALPEAAEAPAGARRPRTRSNFEPVALWQAALETAEDGSFCAEFSLPDTLTTYEVYALALDASGESFGKAKESFLVNQKLMLSAGTPFFMSVGDKLLLPLTVTNNSDTPGEWEVCLSNDDEAAATATRAPQHVALDSHRSATLFFEVDARQEGPCTLRWTATARSASLESDAVEGSFTVRYPAPLLKEAHRLVLAAGAEPRQTSGLLAAELATSTRGELLVEYSTSPLIHLAGSMDFLLQYPYGCTEQRSSALLPWLFYEQLAPFCPHMAQTGAEKARTLVHQSIGQILARQQEDGGLSYWPSPRGERAESCDWASAYAALVLTIAQEQGFEVPQQAMEKLRHYLVRTNWHPHAPLIQYAAVRSLGRGGEVNRILVKALRKEQEQATKGDFRMQMVDLEFMASLCSNPAGRHEALLSWMRSKGRDARHRTSWSGGWTLIALSEYLRLEPLAVGQASLSINGETQVVQSKPGRLTLRLRAGQSMQELMPSLAASGSSVYVNLRAKAQPGQTEYPGVTEKGLQVTRVYELRGEDGIWRAATEFKTGDIVRVTLTCAKIADELEYFVLEDYLPSCMEAINPHVPSQAVGLEDGGWGRWSRWFDHKEYLADRVRGFCTRWSGRDLVNMSYYARVKRAGTSIAPPAEAQLMYEPQTYGLSPNQHIHTHPGER